MPPPSDQPAVRERLWALVLGLTLAGIGWLSTVAPDPPSPLPSGARADDFSAERALIHVRAITPVAHPIDSPENAAVRGYLTNQLGALGITAELQPFTCRNGTLHGVNVMGRIPGTRTTNQPVRAVALVGHYDSVPAGPGASDDGAAVAAILETARALKAGPALRNDVILLFTDGEEVPGELPGAQAFVTTNPWMRDIGCVFNFDARGVSGPELMYETSAGNERLIREFARSSSRPVANSLMSEVYRRMPNDTDFTVFRRAGVPGLNFAFIGQVEHYHRPSDDLAHLHLDTLQHAGSLALGLARHFGNLDLNTLPSPHDLIYFDLLGRVLIRYPAACEVPLALLGLALFAGVTQSAIKRKEVSGWKLVTAGLVWGVNLALVVALFGFNRWPHGLTARLLHSGIWPYWFIALGLTAAICTTWQSALGRWLGPTNQALGALWWWLLLALASAFWLPGASFLFLWPLVFALLGVLLAGPDSQRPWLRTLCLAATATPMLLVVVPALYGAYVALGPALLAVPMTGFALIFSGLSLQAAAVSRLWKWALPVTGVLMATAAAVLVWAGSK
jgi:hypothetical protein